MTSESTKNRDRSNRIDPEYPGRRIERLVQSARIEGQRVWLELLRDREEWNATPEWAQDEAIKAVFLQLGADYSYLGAQYYECGGQRHRVGRFEHRSTAASFNLLPGGRWTLGSIRLDAAQPLCEVVLKPFLMGATPITQAQWDKVGGLDGRSWRGANLPIETCSWDEVQVWLKAAGAGLSLPSEAQWEYACRAGTTTEYCYGNDEISLGEVAWFAENAGGQTHSAGAKAPNAFGLYDVHGNVWEWCQDPWHDNYNGAPTDGSAWTTNGDDSLRVIRGGCWANEAEYCRSAFRNGRSSSIRNSGFGFRLCVDLE